MNLTQGPLRKNPCPNWDFLPLRCSLACNILKTDPASRTQGEFPSEPNASSMQNLSPTTGAADGELGSNLPRVGGTIRRLREARSMTLQDLAQASGVSVGMLSQIERDRANPSLRVLTQIRMALGVSVSALFDQPHHPSIDPAFVRRRDQRPRLELGYLSKELLSSGTPNSLQFMILHVPPLGTSGGQPMSYAAEKGGMLLEGAIYLRVGDEEVLLAEGDSFLFDGVLPHSFRNPNDAPAQLLWIIGAVRAERQL
jgi:transcriptional regulator with XRE-family HTH domain